MRFAAVMLLDWMTRYDLALSHRFRTIGAHLGGAVASVSKLQVFILIGTPTVASYLHTCHHSNSHAFNGLSSCAARATIVWRFFMGLWIADGDGAEYLDNDIHHICTAP